MSAAPEIGVTFDLGQTLFELDPAMLARRLAERGHTISTDLVEASLGPAWRAYDDFVRQGLGGHPWKIFMAHVLEGAGVSAIEAAALADWLFTEQLTQNLWRRPIAGMIELAQDLRAANVPIAIVSNSEGKLAEFIAELGYADLFDVIADSGRLGIEKPDPRIFAWAAERIAMPLDRLVHIGDSHSADIAGALGAGMRAIWFRGTADAPHRDVPDFTFPDASRGRVCGSSLEVRAALVSFGAPIALASPLR